jgi:Leucine Rich Repeat (LRR) protein
MSVVETTVAPSSTKPPAAKHRRRWLQFSLRSLTIFMVACSVLFGAFGWRLQRARSQARAVATLRSMGAEVGYEYCLRLDEKGAYEFKKGSYDSPVPGFLRKLLGDDFFHDASVVLRPWANSQVELNTAWNAIGELPHLKILEMVAREGDHRPGLANLGKTPELQAILIRTGTADARSLAVLQKLTQLRQIHVLLTEFDDALLEEISGLPHLRELSIHTPHITAAGTAAISKHKNLEVLVLRPGRLDNRSLQPLSQLSALRRLVIEEGKFDDEGLKALAGLKNLEWLEIAKAPVGDEGMKSLLGMRNLRHLNLNGTQISSAGLRTLTSLAQLEELNLQGTHIDDGGLPSVEQFPNLRELILCRTSLTDEGLLNTKLPLGLTRLSLEETGVSDIGLRTIFHLRKLRYVGTAQTWITAETASALPTAIPGCSVSYGYTRPGSPPKK